MKCKVAAGSDFVRLGFNSGLRSTVHGRIAFYLAVVSFT